MTTYFVSRHPGAVEWIKQQNIIVDHVLPHLDTSIIKQGDLVVGTLPINLVSELGKQGACYLHLSLEIPADKRGSELSVTDMDQLKAQLIEYKVIKK